MKKVSIITICFNAENVIENTMKSVLNQTYCNYEYIIIDGNSTDNTKNIIRQVINEYPNKDICFVSERDKGIYDAINKGVKHSKGEWISCMNSGDVFHNANVLDSIFSRPIPPNISVIYSDHITMLKNGMKMRGHNDMNKHVYGFNHQSVIYKKELHNQYGFYINIQKLIISDTLFFAPIPSQNKMKVDTIIADYEEGGVSGKEGFSIFKQNLCAEYIFKEISFEKIIYMYYKRRLMLLIPDGIRKYIRKIRHRGEYEM